MGVSPCASIVSYESNQGNLESGLWFLLFLHLAALSYSWIGHGLQNGPTLAFLLWLSEFKTKTSFGFLIKTIRGCFFIFSKIET